MFNLKTIGTHFIINGSGTVPTCLCLQITIIRGYVLDSANLIGHEKKYKFTECRAAIGYNYECRAAIGYN